MSESLANLSAALVAASAEMPAVAFDATNPFLHNRFASLGSVIATARPILARHGLAVMQFACSDTAGRVGVRTRLMHSSGEFLEETIYLEVIEEKGKSKAQAAGSAITYLRRYAQSALLNLYADEDTDGNAPGSDSTHRPAKPSSTPVASPKAPTTGAAAQGEAKGSASPNPEACKARFLEIIREKKWEPFAWKMFIDFKAITANQKLDDAPADNFPLTKEGSDKLLRDIKALMDQHSKGGMSQELAEAFDKAYLELPMDKEAETAREPWMDMTLHFGPQKGTKLIDLDRKKLYGWAKSYEPKPYNGKISPQDAKLRKALDNALSWLDQNRNYQPPPMDSTSSAMAPSEDDVPF